MSTSFTPEQQARVEIDHQLEACGWQVQSREPQNLFARRGVAIREFPLKTGYADYLLCVDGKAIGAVEATFSANPRRAERRRQSILKQVFASRLGPQDPADEPASVLLERNSGLSRGKIVV